MKKILLYSYSKCSTCRKAEKWLDQNNISFQKFDIVKEPPSSNYIELALIQFSLDKKKIFNTRGKSFKSISTNFKNLSDEKMIQLLSNDGKLIKRPFLVIDDREVLVGFFESVYSNKFQVTYEKFKS